MYAGNIILRITIPQREPLPFPSSDSPKSANFLYRLIRVYDVLHLLIKCCSLLLSQIINPFIFHFTFHHTTVLKRFNYCGLRQFCAPHQPAVAFAGGTTTFIYGPHDETLSTAHITGRKYTIHICFIDFVFGFGI